MSKSLSNATNKTSQPVKKEPKPQVPNSEAPKEPKVSKKQTMLDMLKRPEGVTIAELEKATGWQSHSVRGALVNLKNKDKHPITNAVDDQGTRRYRISEEQA